MSGTLYLHVIGQVSALPVTQSDVILVGEVTDAKAYLSNDRVGIYSEFAIRADEVLKNGSPLLITPTGSVVLEREGGRVRFPSGSVQRYAIANQGMPQVGKRYLLFLKSIEDDQDFSIITGYELNTGRVSPLDGKGTTLHPRVHRMAAYPV
jgi:hypothetical protein